MATTYTYVAADLRTGAPLATLPLNEVTIEETLNEPGSASATLPLYGVSAALAPQLRAVTLPGRTALYVIADQTRVLWGGIIWKRRVRDHSLALEAAGFLSYYARTRINADLKFAGADQLDIARGLLRYAHGKPGGDIGIALGSGASGVKRDRTYLAEDRTPVWDALRELTRIDDAFDVAVRCDLTPTGEIERRLDLGHPVLGRPAGNPDLLIEYPGNATDWEWPEEGDRMSTVVFVRAEKDTATGAAPAGKASDDVLIDLGYPRLEEEFTAASGGTTQLTADQQAAALLAAYNHPVTLPSFTVPSGSRGVGPNPVDYAVGDWFRVRVTDPVWFPAGPGGVPGLDVPMRLAGRSVTLSAEGGGESTALTFNPYPAATAIIA